MNTSAEKLIDYCSGIANEFTAKLNRIRSFIPDHKLSSGTANEMLLRDFLAKLTANQFEVGQGFICDPTASDMVSKQCDILVFNRKDYPLVYSEGEVKIVFPQSVRMLIEVKTSLSREKLYDAIDNISVAKSLYSFINGVVFAFKSPKLPTILQHLQDYPHQIGERNLPMAILLLDQGVIIHRWPGTEIGGTGETFIVRESDTSGIVLTFLLMLFFDVQMLSVVGGAGIVNTLQDILNQKTRIISTSIQIGQAKKGNHET